MTISADAPFSSPDAAAHIDDDVVAVVCVPTFRRPEMLRATLESLSRQTTHHAFRVVVVDNDAQSQAGLRVAGVALAEGHMAGTAVIETQQGNCHAINTALSTARATYPTARYLLMIDDDEVAAADWLEKMIGAAEREKADIVGGPVFPVFINQPPRPIGTHPVFWPAYDASGPVPMIYGSGNFLIRQSAFKRLAKPEFDTVFNHLGGGDTDFFVRCKAAGLRSYWEHCARIDETVPASRTTVRWILQRGLRIGAINYRLDRRKGTGIVAYLKNAALVPISMGRALRLLAAGKGMLQASHPLVIAAGRVFASLGIEPSQYRAKPVSVPEATTGAAKQTS